MASINDFLGKGNNYKQDVEMYEAQKTKELRKNNPTAPDYIANPGEVGIAMKHWDKGGGSSKSIGTAVTNITQLSSPTNGTFQGKEYIGLENYEKGIGGIKDAFESGGGVAALWKGVVNVEEQATEVLRQQRDVRNTINSQMGVTGKLGDDIRDTILTSASAGQRLGFSIKDSTDAFINLNNQTGRFATVSQQILEEGFKTAGAFLPSLSELGNTYAEFEKIGIGFRDTLADVNDIGKMSMEIGLNGKATIADVRANIDMINRYNFKNGTQGLAEMSRVAKIFRTDMRDAFTVAEKVMDPEGAIEMSARLQALGGSIGEFNDVYKLMYDSVNDPGAIQKALISMSSGLASYNEQAGKFELTGYGIRMLNEQAKITGVSYKSLADGAIAAQEKMRGLQELSSTGIKFGNEKEKDFLLNMAKMEHGEMKITIPAKLQEEFVKMGTPITDGMAKVRDLNDRSFSQIIQYQKEFEKMNPEDIARGQYTVLQNISNDVSAISSYVRARMVQGVGGVAKGLGLEAGAEYAAKALDLQTSNLTQYIESNQKFSKEVAATVQKGLNFISLGMTGKAKDAFNQADLKLSEELRKKRNSTNLTNGTPGQINTKSLIEQTVGSNPTASNSTSNTQTRNVNVTVGWQPNNMVTELQKQATKDSNIMAQLMGDQNPNSYTNPAMLGPLYSAIYT